MFVIEVEAPALVRLQLLSVSLDVANLSFLLTGLRNLQSEDRPLTDICLDSGSCHFRILPF